MAAPEILSLLFARNHLMIQVLMIYCNNFLGLGPVVHSIRFLFVYCPHVIVSEIHI